MVECDLAKVDAGSSNLLSRSNTKARLEESGFFVGPEKGELDSEASGGVATDAGGSTALQ